MKITLPSNTAAELLCKTEYKSINKIVPNNRGKLQQESADVPED